VISNEVEKGEKESVSNFPSSELTWVSNFALSFASLRILESTKNEVEYNNNIRGSYPPTIQ